MATPFEADDRFRAFVSYSHDDAAFAGRLQKHLESYRVPRRLVQTMPALADMRGRVGPVFRDNEDLPASADLSEAVKDALARSQALIVVCSPSAVSSLWVAREIALFRAIHPKRPVLAALLQGSPETAFPAAMTEDGVEPLAADFRRSGSGRKLAFLKIVAGILGIPLDELIQRDGQRRNRRVMAVTAASVASMIVLATMTILAIDARREAEHQRAQAEGLVEYMLTDVRPTLKAVGRLDVMSKLNQRAIDYYEDESRLDRLPDDGLERRARVIGAMGEDDENGGNPDRARRRYEELYRTTEALLAKDPSNPVRILAHARSENRLALLAFTLGDLDEAGPRLRFTRRLLDSIKAWGREDVEWLRLSAYAHGNSCATMLRRGEDKSAARDLCLRAVNDNERLAAIRPNDTSASYDLVFHLCWLAEAQHAAGQEGDAKHTQARYLGLMNRLIERDPENMLWREQQMQLYVRHAKFLQAQGQSGAARKFLDEARAISRKLVERDPKNAIWADFQKRLSAPSARSE